MSSGATPELFLQTALHDVRHHALALAHAEQALAAAVHSARDQGATWEQIGVSLGVTEQAASPGDGSVLAGRCRSWSRS